jgi:DNA-binding transcriptional MerR regulator
VTQATHEYGKAVFTGQEEWERAREAAEQSRQGLTLAAVSAGGAMVAFNEGQGLLGGVLAAFAALSLVSAVNETPDDSIEKTVFRMGLSIEELRQVIAELDRTGRTDDERLNNALASIRQQAAQVQRTLRRETFGAVGNETVINMTGRTVRTLNRMVSNRGNFARSMARRQHERAATQFERIELEYGKLLALVPYQIQEAQWDAH